MIDFMLRLGQYEKCVFIASFMILANMPDTQVDKLFHKIHRLDMLIIARLWNFCFTRRIHVQFITAAYRRTVTMSIMDKV